MSDAEIKIFLEGLFVDDCRYVTSSLAPGVRWSNEKKSFIFREDWKKEDLDNNESNQQRTSKELCNAMNSIYSNIKFTIETEEDFPNKRLPTLDFAIWMENEDGGKFLRYSFYEKPMKTPYSIMKSSAMSEKSKIQILSQDLIRRMLNVCVSVTQDEKNEIIDNYTVRLFRSGYNNKQVREIVVSGLTGFEKKVRKAAKEKIPLHRPASVTLKTRLHKKLTQRENWYKKMKKRHEPKEKVRNKSNNEQKQDIPLVSLMFVQQTPGSQLLQQLRQVEAKVSDLTGDRVKMVERSGTKLRHLLVSSDPWSNVKCGDSKCIVCTNPFNTNYNCRKRNVCYKTFCIKCAEEAGADNKTLNSNVNNQITFYFGETFRDAFTRGCEHVADYYAKSEDSHMYKHITDMHPDCKPRDIQFGMSVIKKHRSSFERMILEAVLIYRGGLNCKCPQQQEPVLQMSGSKIICHGW